MPYKTASMPAESNRISFMRFSFSYYGGSNSRVYKKLPQKMYGANGICLGLSFRHMASIPICRRTRIQETARTAISPEAPKGMPRIAASLMSPPPMPPPVAKETVSRSRKPQRNPRKQCRRTRQVGASVSAAGIYKRHQGRKASRAALRIRWCLWS